MTAAPAEQAQPQQPIDQLRQYVADMFPPDQRTTEQQTVTRYIGGESGETISFTNDPATGGVYITTLIKADKRMVPSGIGFYDASLLTSDGHIVDVSGHDQHLMEGHDHDALIADIVMGQIPHTTDRPLKAYGRAMLRRQRRRAH